MPMVKNGTCREQTEMQHNLKKRHHFLPKLYLKGFADKAHDPHVWMYERGIQYCPSRSGDGRNPQRLPVSRAGMIENLYAYEKDGTIEYDKIENELEKLEKPHDNIIRKIRAKDSITQEEKETFARYIDLMMKRVPSGLQWSSELATKSLDLLKPELEKQLVGDWDERRRSDGASAEEIRSELDVLLAGLSTAFQDYEKLIPYEVLLLGLLRPVSPVGEFISQMTWQFLVAPASAGFVTSDNPVVMDKIMGIASPQAEVIFPVSTEVALVASNHKNLRQGRFGDTFPDHRDQPPSR
jgi:hypothetical protein